MDHQPLRNGPDRFVRNPIYCGMCALAFGTVLVSGEVKGLIGLALLILSFGWKMR